MLAEGLDGDEADHVESTEVVAGAAPRDRALLGAMMDEEGGLRGGRWRRKLADGSDGGYKQLMPEIVFRMPRLLSSRQRTLTRRRSSQRRRGRQP
jgi:hypothetical protein